ncbi:MAG: actin-binding protein [Pseudobdellovibrionaceae bacterium]
MATTTMQKIIENLSGNKGIQNLLENFQKLNDEIKKKESELKGRFDKQKEEKIELAWKKYQEIVKVLGVSEKKIEKEVNSTISKIKKSANGLEKNIAGYKKKVLAQKAMLEKSIFNKKAKAKTKASPAKKAAPKAKVAAAGTKKVATKKAVVRKATKKTTKKV